MRHFVLSVVICGMIEFGCPTSVSAQQEATELVSVLEGHGKFELAPHGKGNVYAPDVMWDDGRFKMWFGGQGSDGHDRISYAESADGIHWGRKGVVLKDDKVNHVNDPSVVKVEKQYIMYYTRTHKDVVDRIDRATSSDGIHWKAHGAVITPGPEGQWDALSTGRPAVIFDDGLFKMWYDGRKDFPPGTPVKGVPISDTSHRSIGYATSTDGIAWTKHEMNPVFGHDAGAVDVKRRHDTFVMVIESREATRFAVSKNGIEWKEGGVFVKHSASSHDAFGHVTPCLFLAHSKHRNRLFVGAASATTWDHNRIATFEMSDDRLDAMINEAFK